MGFELCVCLCFSSSKWNIVNFAFIHIFYFLWEICQISTKQICICIDNIYFIFNYNTSRITKQNMSSEEIKYCVQVTNAFKYYGKHNVFKGLNMNVAAGCMLVNLFT